MSIFLQIVLLLVGLTLVIKGADFLVDGASDIARKFRVGEFVIGLTIVGFGTSCPELVVSVTGAAQGLSDVAAGNVMGSNITNILLILGLTAVVAPVPVLPKNKKFDLPVLIGTTALLILLSVGDYAVGFAREAEISRWEGCLLLLLFVGYIVWCFKSDASEAASAPAVDVKRKMWVLILLCVGGLVALVVGGRLFVDSATSLARTAGLSEKFIAITILAIGTSLPELVTSIVAARKGRIQMALGNIMGSCVFNILFILGVSALIHPVSMANIDLVDYAVLLGSALMILVSCFTQRDNKVTRTDGVMMLLLQAAYLAFLLLNSAS